MTTPHDYINNCLDVNGSWREAFGDFGIVMTFGADPELEDTIIADCIAEECNLTTFGAAEQITSFIIQNNYILTKDQALSNEDYIRDLLEGIGCDSDLFDEWLESQ